MVKLWLGENFSKMKVLISDTLSKNAVSIFQDRGIEVDYSPNLTTEEFKRVIPDYDGLAIRSNTKVDKDVDTFVPCLDKIPLSSIDNFIVDLSTSHLEIGN